MSEPLIDWDRLCEAATRVGSSLERLRDHRLVFAESCTVGLAAAALGTVPGISRYFLGSAVVYRPETKVEWLGVEASVLEEHSPESAAASLAMVRQVMRRTPSASVAVAVTGHLGPQAPPPTDGVIWLAVGQRWSGHRRFSARGSDGHDVEAVCYAPRWLRAIQRRDRLCEAAWQMLEATAELLDAVND